MEHFRTLSALLLSAAFAVGCEQSPTALAPDQPLFNAGKNGGGGNVDIDSRARFLFTDGLQVYSDGGGYYQGYECGVHAKIFWENPDASQSGDATLDPNGDYSKSSSCGPRVLKVDLGLLGVQAAHFLNVRQVMQLAVDESGKDRLTGTSRIQPFRILIEDFARCESLRFGDNSTGTVIGDPIEVTYTGRNVDGQRTWTAKSTGAHQAGCFEWKKGGYRYEGTLRTVKFELHLTEIPYTL